MRSDDWAQGGPWSVVPIDAVSFAEGLQPRNLMFRTRVVDLMLITMLVLVPLPEETSIRVAAFAGELNVVDDVLRATVAGASGSLGIALIDFERNGYSATWSDEDMSHLHASSALKAGWKFDVDDEALGGALVEFGKLPAGIAGKRRLRVLPVPWLQLPGSCRVCAAVARAA